MTHADISGVEGRKMSALRGLVTLLTGEDRPRTADEEVAEARRDLDAALDALRAARAAWASHATGDLEAVRRALDAAERQLDGARVRLQRALERRSER